jgi:hypothetical protein
MRTNAEYLKLGPGDMAFYRAHFILDVVGAGLTKHFVEEELLL